MNRGFSYKSHQFIVRFLTPAFLGDAEQKGRWRTPPFKALLRQWWRVAYAAAKDFNFDVREMREMEGRLFGNAWLTRRENGKEKLAAERSKVRLRLDGWLEGRLRDWTNREASSIKHPEVSIRNVDSSIGPHLYLGYGPLGIEKKGQQWVTKLQRAPAIDAGEEARFDVAMPEDQSELVQYALFLMHLYGSVGGRSRNGWGSFVLDRKTGDWPQKFEIPVRDWKQALTCDWPHAVGADQKGPLVWQTAQPSTDWKQVMRTLALIRMAVRTQFPFSTPAPHQAPEKRHWLAYPVTNHVCQKWGKQFRLPNSLRFKVRPAPGHPGKLVGVIFHVPCSPPSDFAPQGAPLQSVWEQVHWLLDALCKPADDRHYKARVEDPAWLQRVAPQLTAVQLQRVER